MSYNPNNIADVFIHLNKNKGGLKLFPILLLTYLAHGFYLAITGKPLAHKRPEAWRFGPIFKEVYDARSGQLGHIKDCLNIEKDNLYKDKNAIQIIKEVDKVFGDFRGWELAALTHAEDQPWKDTFNNGAGDGQPINNDLIQKNFLKRLKKEKKRGSMNYVGYSPITVSNYIVGLNRYDLKIKDLTLLKLIKLCYISHGFNLAVNDRPLLAERPQAWAYGPVFPSVYHAFKEVGKGIITDMLQCEMEHIHGEEADIINLVCNKYGKLSGHQLSALCHADGTPWAQARINNWKLIDSETMKRYYTNLHNQKGD